MVDDTRRKQPEDPRFINTSQEWEIEYWCKRLGCTRRRLLQAVSVVGNGAVAVANYLKSGD